MHIEKNVCELVCKYIYVNLTIPNFFFSITHEVYLLNNSKAFLKLTQLIIFYSVKTCTVGGVMTCWVTSTSIKYYCLLHLFS